MKDVNAIIDHMKTPRERGFTMVELSLAMSFLAFIMIFVVIVLLQLMNIYNKGIAMSQINETGRQIADDISNYIKFAKADSIVYAEGGERLCTGQVSYLWNKDGSSTNKFSDGSSFSMVRVDDNGAAYCSDLAKRPSASDSGTTILTGSAVSILSLTVSQYGSILQMKLVLSTAGDNKPVQKDDSSWTCVGSGGGSSNNPYCFYATFDNTVYTRGG